MFPDKTEIASVAYERKIYDLMHVLKGSENGVIFTLEAILKSGSLW